MKYKELMLACLTLCFFSTTQHTNTLSFSQLISQNNSINSQSLHNIRIHLMRSLLAASAGLTCEIVFTALCDFHETKNPELAGKTYLWMIPLYASIYPLYTKIYPRIAHLPLLVRALSYVCMIYAGEYVSGQLLRMLIGRCPWEKNYHGKKWSVHDLIRLDYAPAWFIAALLFEEVCHTLHK